MKTTYINSINNAQFAMAKDGSFYVQFLNKKGKLNGEFVGAEASAGDPMMIVDGRNDSGAQEFAGNPLEAIEIMARTLGVDEVSLQEAYNRLASKPLAFHNHLVA